MPVHVGEIETTVDVRGAERGGASGGAAAAADAPSEVQDAERRFRAARLGDRLAEDRLRLADRDRDD